jgi:hypothetical protein
MVLKLQGAHNRIVSETFCTATQHDRILKENQLSVAEERSDYKAW